MGYCTRGDKCRCKMWRQHCTAWNRNRKMSKEKIAQLIKKAVDYYVKTATDKTRYSYRHKFHFVRTMCPQNVHEYEWAIVLNELMPDPKLFVLAKHISVAPSLEEAGADVRRGLEAIEDNWLDLGGWVQVVASALEGARYAGYNPEDIVHALQAHLKKDREHARKARDIHALLSVGENVEADSDTPLLDKDNPGVPRAPDEPTVPPAKV